jgi:methyl-accepting chemotaxis protein
MLGNIKVARKLWLLVAIALSGSLMLVLIDAYELRRTLFEDRKLITRNVVETAWGMVDGMREEVAKGRIDREKGEELLLNQLRKTRYAGSEYFWVNDLQHVILMHPVKPELEGKELSQTRDANGKYIFREFVKVARADGEGYVDYLWPKPGNSDAVPKLSFVKLVPEWNWIIGSGIYIDDVEDQFVSHLVQSVLIWLIITVITLLMVYTIVRNITDPLTRLTSTIQGVKDGDLRLRTEIRQLDEIGVAAAAFDEMVARIGRFVDRVGSGIESLSSASTQMTAITSETNRGVSEQRSHTEQAATAMNEMSATVQEVARNTASAAEAAHSANSEADSGRKVVESNMRTIGQLANEVERVAEAIHRLESDSESIGGVLDVIRGVAEQTNLLALNAAIEAARAGEQGRGFAVVADEVRTLASRTQKSTQEIQQMIETLQAGAREAVTAMDVSRKQAAESVDEARKANDSLNAIAQAVNRINDMNTQIASAAEEQSAVTEEVNRNVNTISEIADRNAGGAEQNEQASRELRRLAESLREMVAAYKT